MKHKIVVIINIIFLTLVIGLAILQYFWLEKVRITELFRMKKELVVNTVKFIYDINYDFFKLYDIFKFDNNDNLEKNNNQYINRISGLFNNKQIDDFVQTLSYIKLFYNGNKFDLKEVFLKESGNNILLQKDKKKYSNLLKELEYLNKLSINYSLQFFYYVSLKEDSRIIIPIYKRNGKIDNAVVVFLNEKYLYKDYFQLLINRYFDFNNNSSDYIIQIIDYDEDHGKELFSINHDKLKNNSKADIINPLLLKIPVKYITNENINKFHNDFLNKNLIFRAGENRNLLFHIFNKMVNKNDANQGYDSFSLFRTSLEEKLKLNKPYVDQILMISNELGTTGIKITHKSGSIDKAALYKQLVNVVISFSILLILSLTMTLLLNAYRNLHNIKNKEMEFITSITHELCTPIAVINSAGENLNAGVIKNSEKIKEYGSLISEESKRLKDMVEKILIYSGVKNNRFIKSGEPVDIEKIIEKVLKLFTPSLQQNNISVELFVEKNLPLIFINEKDIYSIIQNLISNVIKHAKIGKWMKISIKKIIKRNKNILYMEVEDKGNGVKQKELTKIFDSFYRAEGTIKEQIPGSGFGLFLVKKIIRLYHGKIKVESVVGKGTKFIIYLPFRNIKA